MTSPVNRDTLAPTFCFQGDSHAPDRRLPSLRTLAYALKGEYNSSIEGFDRAIELEPNETGFSYNLALVLYEAGNYTGAEEILENLTGLHPECAACWNRLGLARVKLERFTSAIDAYDEAISLDSNYLEPWNNRGIAQIMGDQSPDPDYTEALKSFEMAIKIDPNCMEAWANRAKALRLLGRSAEANEAFERAERLGYRE